MCVCVCVVCARVCARLCVRACVCVCVRTHVCCWWAPGVRAPCLRGGPRKTGLPVPPLLAVLLGCTLLWWLLVLVAWWAVLAAGGIQLTLR